MLRISFFNNSYKELRDKFIESDSKKTEMFDFIYVGATGKTNDVDIRSYIESKFETGGTLSDYTYTYCEVLITKERNLHPLDQHESELIEVAIYHWRDRCVNDPDAAGNGLPRNNTGTCYDICWKGSKKVTGKKRKLVGKIVHEPELKKQKIPLVKTQGSFREMCPNYNNDDWRKRLGYKD